MFTKSLQLTAIAFTVAALSACSTAPQTPPQSDDAEVMALLATHSDRASRAMQKLAALKAGQTVQVEAGQVPAGLEVPISLSWSGPVDQLVAKVASLTGYQFGGVIGRTKTPLLVSITIENHTAFNVLADAGAQVGSAAEIVVHPDTKKLFVRYASAVRTGGFPVAK